ncbi:MULTISPECIES: DMT family transporter [unclassified Microbacterium]|uniref:DMT family transporter n=1 Tax=unclassified Microbacterium TaxID=2609290 RepID=UPI000AFAE6A3|nr:MULTISPECIES: DMT family transporter [unclassified Microbacterium]MBN9180890.1 DMT family transporter [Microbacterium sp.]MBN9188071.1 DMT family transporter [Microbacterium sp.]MBN9194342.1 DMT family transporter [Microbacterium sp.]
MTAATSGRRRLPVWLALCGAGFIGMLTAIQARVNGQLGVRLHDGFTAAVISFGSGLAILIVLSVALPVGRRGFRTLVTGARERTIPWWMLIAGAAGALTVATQGIAVGVIGVSLFTVGYVAGQIVCGLFLDRVGFGPGGVVAVTMPRVLGGLLALLAVGVALAGGAVGEAPLWMLLLPFAAGIGVAWQQATNGRLRARVGTPLTATLMNFITGTVVLAIAAIVHVSIAGAPRAVPSDWWLYLGGALGVAYIFLSAALVSYTGVLLLALGTVVGQLAMSVVLDALWPASATPGLWQEVLTVSLAFLSVAVAAIPWRRMR